MKKLFLTMCLVIAAQTAFAQTAGSLIDQFKNEPKAEFVHIPRLMMALGKAAIKSNIDDEDDLEGYNLIKNISSIHVLDLEECSPQVRKRFAEAAGKLQTKGYEELMRANGDGETTRILLKKKGKIIRELLILNGGKDGGEAVQIKGNISMDDIDRLVKDNNIYNK